MAGRVICSAILAIVLLASCGPVLVVQTQSAAATPATSEAAPTETGEAVVETCTSTVPGACDTEYALTTVITYLTLFAEFCGALVIGVAVVRGILGFLPHVVGRERDDTYKDGLRLRLGKSLALALEFQVGADILKTAVAPTLPVIAQLAAVIVLRTVLNYFLERELRHVEERRGGDQTRDSAQSTAS